MGIIVTILATLAAIYAFMACWFHYGFRRRMPLCGFVLSPAILERIEERLRSEGKTIPRWVTEGRNRRCR